MCSLSSTKDNDQTPVNYDMEELATEHEPSPAKKTKMDKTRDSSLNATLDRNVDEINRSQFVNDEFYHFGMNIAHQLRAMPIDEALECQTDLMDYLARKRRHLFGMNHVNKN